MSIVDAAKWSWMIAWSGILLHSAAAEDPAPFERPPNIILIVADDLGYGELGCYGQRWIKTPNIDRLAAEGIRFTQFYCGQAVCAPSRCSLMTGLHQGHTFIRDNGNPAHRGRPQPDQMYFPGQHPIPDETVTMAERLKSRGYATAAIGKWGLGYEGSSGDPLRQGFDLFYGFLCQVHAHNHYPRFLWRNSEQQLLKGNDRTLTGKTFSQDKFTEVALDFVRRNHEQPFFLYLPLAIPHLSIQVPEDSLEEYKGKIPEADYEHRGYLEHPFPRAGYAAMVSHIDRDIGKLTALVEQLGIDENTVILFTSDNGPTYDRLGGSDSVFFESSGPLRGRKGSLWEGGIRVPLVARWPGKIEPGQTSSHISAFWDLLPTFCELAGENPPSDIDGVSLAPTLRGGRQPVHDHLYWEFRGYGGQQAVRKDRWKAIRRDLLKKPDAAFQLYDLHSDVAESTDLAAEHPEIIAQIKAICHNEHEPSDLWPFPALDPPAPAAQERPTQPARVPTGDEPNIIVIISDDAGYADFSVQGSKTIDTLQIDSIAKRGIQFSQGYVTASVCSPSRAGLLTGRYQQRFGHEMNVPPQQSASNGLPVDEQTLADVLQSHGYQTIALGKWHLGYAGHFHPNRRGFDEFYGFLQGARSYWPMEQPTLLNRLQHNGRAVAESFEYLTDDLGRRAADYVVENKDRPFFMYLCFNAVHTPMHAREDDLPQPERGVSPKRQKLVAMTRALDRSVGRVLDALQKNGLTEKTIVFFVNDNGGATNNDSDNGQLRGRKGSPFEGGVRVPFLVAWPEQWPQGQVYDHPVSTLDIFPTVIRAAGYRGESEKKLDGVDLAPFLSGENSLRPHSTLYWRRGRNWAIREGDWKLLSYQGSAPMLFDLATDTRESNDLAADQPDRVGQLRAKFEEWNSELATPKWRYRAGGNNKKKKNQN